MWVYNILCCPLLWTLWTAPTGESGDVPYAIESGDWYVSAEGFNQVNCKSRQYPCHTLKYVINMAAEHDVIHIDGGQPGAVYPMELEGLPYGSLDKSISLKGYNGKPHLDLTPIVRDDNETYTVTRQKTDGAPCHVTLSSLTLQNGDISFGNCSTRISNVTFLDASIKSPAECLKATLVIQNSDWYGRQTCDESCMNPYINEIKCYEVDLTITESKFYQQVFVVLSHKRTHILVTNSLFDNVPNVVKFLGGLHFTFGALDANITIANCTFQNQIHPTRVASVINLYEAAIWLKASQISRTNETTNAIVIVEDCSFYNNERGMTMVGPFRFLEIHRSLFVGNMAMHAGAAILVLVNKATHLVIQNCNFTSNIAGSYRQDYITKEKAGAFEVVGSEVHLNAECCKGVVTMVGKGGAVRVQRGQVTLRNSTFTNNTARLLGGSVFVDIDGLLNILNSHFENTPSHNHSLQGDILYSDGKMKVDQVVLDVQTAVNGLSILRHSGDHWSLDITNVWIQCPMGYDLRTTNSSAYGVTAFGLRRSYKLDQLSYYCESCPRNKYSLDRGYLNYTMKFIKFAYFTLLINGSTPKPEYTGQYIHHEIRCDDCPYGGHCVQGITSVANFWGYKHQKEVRFQHCPKGYCCSTPQCPAIDACSENREGRLCGRCKAGYSEALFSPVCVKNDKCGPVWLWPFAISIGLFYAMFLLFQTDLKNFLFNKPLLICKKCAKKGSSKKKKSKRKKDNYMNGKVKHELVSGKPPEDSDNFLNHVSEAEDNGMETVLNHVNNSYGNGKKGGDAKSGSGGGGGDGSESQQMEFTASDSGFLIVIFYYFQDALLLHVQTVYVTSESKTQVLVKSILSGLLRFQLDIFEMIEEVCVVPNMTAVPKKASKAIIVPYIIFIFLFLYIIYRWMRLFRGSSSSLASSGRHHKSSGGKSFGSRLSSGFILALLFMFQKMGTTTFTLLNCVPTEDAQVLFLDGTVTCYQYWQYGVMAYAIACISPFFIVLLTGPSLLYRGHISLAHFFMACLFPMPFLVWWMIQTCRGRYRRPVCDRRHLAEGTRSVIGILQGPYKENSYGLCWGGVLIGRRLVLILLFTFVNDALIRLLVMLLACFCILLHHVHVQPYKDKRGNVAGTCSAAALVTLGTINLVRAGFEAAEYTPSGPNAFLMRIFGHIENTLLLWIPLAIMCGVTLLFLFRLFSCVFTSLCTSPEHSQTTTTNNRSSAGSSDPPL